jgi:hypothetical protein
MGHEKRSALGEAGRQYVQEKYNFENFAKEWDKTLTAILEKHGSWSTRSGYQKYEFKEIA